MVHLRRILRRAQQRRASSLCDWKWVDVDLCGIYKRHGVGKNNNDDGDGCGVCLQYWEERERERANRLLMGLW